MTVSSTSGSVASQYHAVQNDRTVLALKKTQDAAKAQAQALVELIKTTTEDIGRQINVYA